MKKPEIKTYHDACYDIFNYWLFANKNTQATILEENFNTFLVEKVDKSVYIGEIHCTTPDQLKDVVKKIIFEKSLKQIAEIYAYIFVVQTQVNKGEIEIL